MKLFETTIDSTLIEKLKIAVQAKENIQGYTHNFYRYPARFSPKFVREVIELFTNSGDVVLDPFVGGGTTLVESLLSQRHSIGFDVSPIATFVSKTKTTVLSANDIFEIESWAFLVLQKKINGHKAVTTFYDDEGYLNNLPWRLKISIEIILAEIDELKTDKQKHFAKCIVLRTAQWAIDCKKNIPTTSQFRIKFWEILKTFVNGMEELRKKVKKASGKKPHPFCLCVNESSEFINQCEELLVLPAKPKLVITSPPYVGVHMLYHQWQVNGRKRTRTPFWIIDSLDGMGSGHYTFGHYQSHAKKTYFEIAEKAFKSIYSAIDDNAIIVQLVGFSDHKKFLPKYLEMMQNAGYEEFSISTDILNRTQRIWRDVPNRKWYFRTQNQSVPSREVLLIHRKK